MAEPQGRNKIETFPARLAELREGKGLSREELATAAGTSYGSVYELEAGRRSPSLELAGRLADALGVSVDDLRRPAGTPAKVRRAAKS